MSVIQSSFVMTTYSYAFGALLLLPISLIFSRRDVPWLKLSVVGAIVLLVGFYAVLYGKAREGNRADVATESSSNKPLLQGPTFFIDMEHSRIPYIIINKREE